VRGGGEIDTMLLRDQIQKQIEDEWYESRVKPNLEAFGKEAYENFLLDPGRAEEVAAFLDSEDLEAGAPGPADDGDEDDQEEAHLQALQAGGAAPKRRLAIDKSRAVPPRTRPRI